MYQFLLDTDHLTLFEQLHLPLVNRLAAQAAGATALSAVTVEEAMRGRLASLAQATNGPRRISGYTFLLGTLQTLLRFPLLPFDQSTEDHFQRLLALRLRVGTQDLKIASVALANGLTLLTRNRRDFGRVPGLRLDDWSV